VPPLRSPLLPHPEEGLLFVLVPGRHHAQMYTNPPIISKLRHQPSHQLTSSIASNISLDTGQCVHVSFGFISFDLSICLVPDEWGAKAARRRTQGTGRMSYLKNIARRLKNGFRFVDNFFCLSFARPFISHLFCFVSQHWRPEVALPGRPEVNSVTC
jgi:hypothetical protein